VLFPKDIVDFDGYMIAKFLVREIANGVRLGRVQPAAEITIKGKMISLNQAFRYLVRIKRVQGSDREEYEILADGGFRKAERLPLNWNSLGWILKHELEHPSPEAEFWNLMGAWGVQSMNDVTEITEAMLATQPWYRDMKTKVTVPAIRHMCLPLTFPCVPRATTTAWTPFAGPGMPGLPRWVPSAS
jgi:hypothetical protein